MIDCGLRLTQAAQPAPFSLELDVQCILVRGKGGHEDIVPFGQKATAELDRYLRVRARHPKASDPALFIGQAGGLKREAIYMMIQRRARKAGITRSPHQPRGSLLRGFVEVGWRLRGRSAASRPLAGSEDVEAVRRRRGRPAST